MARTILAIPADRAESIYTNSIVEVVWAPSNHHRDMTLAQSYWTGGAAKVQFVVIGGTKVYPPILRNHELRPHSFRDLGLIVI